MLRKVRQTLGAFFVVTAIVLGAVLVFSYPDNTEVRMWIDHWPKLLGIFALGTLGWSMTMPTRKERMENAARFSRKLDEP